MAQGHMGSTQRARHEFIEAIEQRTLLTVFAPDVSFQPPTAFKPPGTQADEVYPVSKNRYILEVSGYSPGYNGDEGDPLDTYTRVSASGKIDRTFGKNGHLTVDVNEADVTFTGSRFIVVGNDESNATLSAYTINGKPDESAGDGTGTTNLTFISEDSEWLVGDANLQYTYPDGSMLINVDLEKNDPDATAQALYQDQLLRVRSDGTPLQSFGNDGVATLPNSLGSIDKVLVTDQGIYAYIFQGDGVTPPADLLTRLTLNGKIDSTYGKNGTATIAAFADDLTALPDGKIVFLEDPYGGPDVVHQLNLDGTPDQSFGGTGSVTVKVPTNILKTIDDEDQNTMTVDSQGRILVATGGTIFRYSTAGVLDSAPFNGTTQFDGFSISEDSQGRIVTTNDEENPADNERYAVVPYVQLDSGGIAHLFGTPAADTVSVDRISNDRYQFIVNGETTDLSTLKVKEIDINLFNGDNKINIDSSVDAPVNAQTGNGKDSITMGNDNDTINPGTGTDTIHCGNGSDFISAHDPAVDDQALSPTVRHIFGGTGNKRITMTRGKAYISLGVGNSNITTYIDTTTHINIAGGSNTLYLYGNDDTVNIGGNGNNYVIADGDSGTQQITTGDGNDDIFIGVLSRATIHGGGGDDLLSGSDDPAMIYGDAGNDTIEAGNGNDYLDGGSGNDHIDARDGNNTVLGGDGNDTLIAGTGNDSLSGQAGNDSLTGGGGTDTLLSGGA